MKVYIANFGIENQEWPACLERNTIAVMNEVEAHQCWEKGNREDYIRVCLKGKTAKGLTPTKSVASRWYNLMTIVTQSKGDLWIHRAGDEIWWAVTTDAEPEFIRKQDKFRANPEVVVCHKPCSPWSSTNKMGNQLFWKGLHARARCFLFTEGTLQQLAPENAQYAVALVNGEDLGDWHVRGDWATVAAQSKSALAVSYSPKQIAIYRMAKTAMDTCAHANGQQIIKTVKNKDMRFTQESLEKHVGGLVELQDGVCAITGLALQFDTNCYDDEMLCSLDRIDSDGHYEAGNLQVVCRFVNRWKRHGDDANFRRLIKMIQLMDPIDAAGS